MDELEGGAATSVTGFAVTRNDDDHDGYLGPRPGGEPGGHGTARTSSRAFVPPGKTTLVEGLVARGLDPTAHVPGAGREDARVDATAGKPQLAQQGHAMQYYRLHQPAFLDAVRTRLLAANLGTGSPRLAWAHGAVRFVEQFGFALTGPESKELPELLYPGDPRRRTRGRDSRGDRLHPVEPDGVRLRAHAGRRLRRDPQGVGASGPRGPDPRQRWRPRTRSIRALPSRATRRKQARRWRFAGEVATLQSQRMATGAPDPVLLETAGLDAETLGFRARVAGLRAGLSGLGNALDAADDGVRAAIANLSGGARDPEALR